MTSPTRNRWVLLGLIVVFAAAGWRALPALGLRGPDVEPGVPDARGFTFALVDAGTGDPVRYPCGPIHYVLNPAGAPEGAVNDVHTAFEMTGTASGLRFEYAGETDERPTPDREVYQPDRYGDTWAPILVGWVTGLGTAGPSRPDEPTPIGLGGSWWEANGQDQPVYVSGQIVFDASVTELPQGFGGETWGQAMLHEIGHLVGLDHTDTPDSVMSPLLGRRPASWGEGDRAGLWLLGLGAPCLAAPDTP